jgi:Arc/MetJ-type ribon-helix-helix transcriptional regulator
MPTAKVAVTIDNVDLQKVDRLVRSKAFPSRSGFIQEAVRQKLQRTDHSRLARECAKLDPKEEKAIAEEGMSQMGATRSSVAKAASA